MELCMKCYIHKTKKTSRNLKMYLHAFQKSKSNVKFGATRKSWNRIIHWRNETDLGLHKEGLGGESISIHMGQKADTRSLRKSKGSIKAYPTIWKTRTFFDGSEVNSSLLNIKEKHAAQELLVGSMASQEEKLAKQEGDTKKNQTEECMSCSHIWATRSVKW